MKYLAIQGAVIRQLEIFGEATKHLSTSTRAMQPHIPWREIAGMRDKLVHGYFSVNLDDVWVTAKNNLAPLQTAVNAIIRHRTAKS